MRAVYHQVDIKAKSRGSFRCGEWAQLAGVAVVVPAEGDKPRLCYLAAFPDGVTDYWPTSEDYELRPIPTKGT